MILVIDNYDSFTFNVIALLRSITDEEVRVVRNDELSVSQIRQLNPTRIILSPGPGAPSEAGVCEEVVREFCHTTPILGICLGHQAICEAFGGKIVRAKNLCHADVQSIALDGKGLFRTFGKRAKFTRYHSLVAQEESLPECLEVSARADDGDIMGVRHKSLCVEGVQFHPESFESEGGEGLLRAFLNYRRENLPHTQILNRLIAKEDLSEELSREFMSNVIDGTMDERVMAALLVGLAAKGVSVSEIVGCARAILEKKVAFDAGGEVSEIVGTGGDSKGSFNVSSLSAIVAASVGLKVAKHGNRAVSSKSGAADFFEALGVNIFATPQQNEELLRRTNFAFLMAPIYHSAMRHAAPVRSVLGIKSVMNLLGPLLNPAGAKTAVLGVYDAGLLQTYAKAAVELGMRRVLVVHSRDGYDEISPCAESDAFFLTSEGEARALVVNPREFGLCDIDPKGLCGADARENARAALAVLNGEKNDAIIGAVCLNAGALLWLSDRALNLQEGFALAKEAIASKRALKKLEEVVKLSQSLR